MSAAPGYFCAGCGGTSRHAEDCPSLRIGRINIPQASEETKALREELDRVHVLLNDCDRRLAALEARAL